MRSPRRIPIFLNLVDGKYTDVLTGSFGLFNDEFEVDLYVDAIYDRIGDIQDYWNENYDERFSQVLVNLGIIPNIPGLWYYKEEPEILLDLGVNPREFLLWGQNYDKDMNRLDRTIWQTIDKLDTDHIEAIIDGGFCKDEVYLDTFKKELELRNK